MTQLALIGLLLILAGAINIIALVMSRRGSDRVHSAAFKFGLVGLCSLPVMLVASFFMVAQTLFATFASPSGMVLASSALLLAVSTLGSLVCTVRLAR